jgi:GNAT superfamily N-acetyltransferase
MPILADAALSSRLESLCAAELRRFVTAARSLDARSGAESLEVAGGVAVYIGPGSPVNEAIGLGFDGRVSPEQIAALEAFYAERGQRGLAIVSPLAEPSLMRGLADRGWYVDGFENVLVRTYSEGDAFAPIGGVDVIEATTAEARELWVEVAAIGFSAPLEPLPEQLELGRIVVSRPGTRLFLATIDGLVAGAAELYVEDGVAWLSADTTLPQFRRRGVQRALQSARLAEGARLGCELAVSEAAPGGSSQRNMERAGFQVVYTRADYVAPLPQLSA